MIPEGKPYFLKHHQGSVRGVSFSPRDRFLFCSGACDGKVNLYSALNLELLMCYQISSLTLARNVTAVRFTMDGSKILAATTARRLAVVDVERGEQLLAYDNCAFSGSERTGLATDPKNPHIAVSVGVNGKGLSLVDLRMPLPLDFIYDLHLSPICDVQFLPNTWPWVRGLQSALLTAGGDGTCRVSALDGRSLHSFETGHSVNSVSASPEPFSTGRRDGFSSLIVAGGEKVSAYYHDTGKLEHFKENKDKHIWKIRYTSNGAQLFTGCEGGILRRYRRYPDRHAYLGIVYQHKKDIEDFDISSYDEFIITGSKDSSVGLMRLGSPSHGWTEISELT